jgi:hypothetical protein
LLLVRHGDGDIVEYRGTWNVLPPALANGAFVHVVRQGAARLHVANTLPWQNPVNQLDSNRDGSVSPIDVLVDVNTLNLLGSRLLPTPTLDNLPEFYHDSSGDSFVSPVDPLQKINFLNNSVPNGEAGIEAVLANRWFRQGPTLAFSSDPANLNAAYELLHDRPQSRPVAAKAGQRLLLGFVSSSPDRSQAPQPSNAELSSKRPAERGRFAPAWKELIEPFDAERIDTVFAQWPE